MNCRIALLGAVLFATPVAAQTDFRNLDRGRPTRVEDAYPVEHYEFELAFGYHVARLAPGRTQHLFEPELTYGPLPNLDLGVGTAFAVTGRGYGLAGLRFSAKYNLTTEQPWLPGVAFRIDAALPLGSEAGSGTVGLASLLATRSFGPNRIHFNASAGLGRQNRAGAAEPMPQWRAALAVDRTLYRTSTLLVLDIVAEQGWNGDAATLSPGIALRRQVTPTLVFDAGMRFHHSAFAMGISYAFAVAGLMPGGGR